MIEIIDEDHIKEKISFLWYDFNYSLGYNNYLESDIVILQQNSLGNRKDIIDK